MSELWLIAGVIFSSVTAPLILAVIQGRQRRGQLRQEYAREDKRRGEEKLEREAVARKAEEAAELLIASNRVVAHTAEVTNGKLDVIHTLVNSSMTAAMQAELEETRSSLVLMREVVRLNKVAGQEPTTEALAAIKTKEEKIAELSAALDDRLKQTKVADAQMEVGKLS